MSPINIGFLLEWDQDRRLRLPMPPGGMTLGRSGDNDYSFPKEDLAPIQCRLFLHQKQIHLQDLSGQGTLINKHRVSDHVLTSRDRIQLGRFSLRLVHEEDHDPDRQKTRKLPTSFSDSPQVRIRWATPKGQTLDHELRSSVVIGTHPDCGIRVADSFVSGHHCALMPTRKDLILRDLGSTNGVWIGPLRIVEAALYDGCEFRVGSTRFQTEIETPSTKNREPETWPYGIVGRHPSMQSALSLLQRMALLPVTVLILGETGTGKELFARALHTMSSRNEKPFIPVNCAAIGKELIESELFGHVKGAFTGATQGHDGAFLAADNGTLFLDEIGELSLDLQGKLLRALELKEIKPVGASKTRLVNTRVVAATNCNLDQMVREGRFRQDLYYRLMASPLELPPLRRRLDDIPLLVETFLHSLGRGALPIHPSAIQRLQHHDWPGNVRELQNVLTTSLIYSGLNDAHDELTESDLTFHHGLGGVSANEDDPIPYGRTAESEKVAISSLADVEKETIRHALQALGGDKSAVAKRLGIGKSTLYEKIKRFNLS